MKKMIVMLALVFAGCSDRQIDKYMQDDGDPDAAYAQSLMRKTVKVRQTITAELRPGGALAAFLGIDVKDMPMIDVIQFESSGSGAIVHSDSDEDESLVLTAWHVCNTVQEGSTLSVLFYDLKIRSVDVDVMTYDSKVLDYDVVAGNRGNDTCVIKTDGYAGESAELAKKAPPAGAMIQITGAPAGVWGRYNVYVNDGRFLGEATEDLHVRLSDTDDDVDVLEDFFYYNVPGMPGNSGGPVWYKGKIISTYNLGLGGSETLGWGPGLDAIREIVSEAKSRI